LLTSGYLGGVTVGLLAQSLSLRGLHQTWYDAPRDEHKLVRLTGETYNELRNQQAYAPVEAHSGSRTVSLEVSK
jgi:hypothetical protein